MYIPSARFATNQTDDEALKDNRRRIREMLANGQPIKVTPQGSATPDPRQDGIVVPEGKFASFYWYEADPDLYRAELQAMRRYFPSFQLGKEADGRLSWVGRVTPGFCKRTYTLQVVYDHSHPHNESYGGSVKVYSVQPDLEEMLGGRSIPHTLRDSQRELYLCTARKEDVKAGKTAGSTVTTAAAAISWAVKWLTVFELWQLGDVTTEQFQSHAF